MDKSDITVAECVAKHLAGIQCGAKTRERNAELSRYISGQAIGRLLVQKLKAADIKQFYGALRLEGGRNGKPLSSTTVRHVHQILRGAITEARRDDVIPINPFDKLTKKKRPSRPSRRRLVRRNELTVVLAGMEQGGDWLLPLVRLALKTGMRRGEILALRGAMWTSTSGDPRAPQLGRDAQAGGGGSHVEFKVPKTEAASGPSPSRKPWPPSYALTVLAMPSKPCSAVKP